MLTTTAPRYALRVYLIEDGKFHTIVGGGDSWRNEELCLAAGYNWLSAFRDNHSEVRAETITRAFLALRQKGYCAVTTKRRQHNITLQVQVAVVGEE